ncbi:TPA: hypothetical protein JBB31_01635 [Legionella pneumophila subsp. pneumophila]|nr:hypothetical protein [Legionella pneumophila subsp. pneumophila]HBD9374277.1 hypothetical protein [Legionella pneumophila]
MSVNAKQWLIPLIVFIICFIVVILSINQIIKLAQSHTGLSTKIQSTKFDEEITNLINNPTVLNYQILENNLPSSFQGESNIKAQFNLLPQIKNLPPIDQDTIIRVKLVEWKVKQLQTQFNTFVVRNNEPIFFKTFFWIWGFLIWIGSIIGGKMLNFLTDKYIINRYWG